LEQRWLGQFVGSAAFTDMRFPCAQSCLLAGMFGLSTMHLGAGHPHPQFFGNFENQFPNFLRGEEPCATVGKEDGKWRISIVVVFCKFRQPRAPQD
jgi:hypothetical protein